MRGKYRQHKRLGVALEVGATIGARHLPFPGIYKVEVIGQGGGGAGGSVVGQIRADGLAGYSASTTTQYLTARTETPVLQNPIVNGSNGSGGSPGNPGASGRNYTLATSTWSVLSFGAPGGAGYGSRTPAQSNWPHGSNGTGGYGGANNGGSGSTGLLGAYRTTLVG